MGRVEAFEVHGCECWMWTGDHGPPHFHARSQDGWEVRIYFMQSPPSYDVKYEIGRIRTRTVRTLLNLPEDHRVELFEQWERSVADE